MADSIIPKLSLCIPTMDRWEFLKENLPKYIENPYIDEIVISDENGADASKITTNLSHPKIKVFINSEKLGVLKNKERAIYLASNDWVAIIDSDNFAPLSYFDAWTAYITLNSISKNIIYAPSRTIATHGHPGFNFTGFIGKPLTKHTYWNLSTTGPTAGICTEVAINTMNYIVNKTFYLESSEEKYKDLFRVNAWDSKLRTWLLLNRDGIYVFPENMEYYHVVHPGSSYTNTANEIHKYEHTINGLYNSWRI
jgi:glycosyltransferase involved in cell wall biosynthesis